MKLLAPTLHLNGTSAAALLDGYAEAKRHVRRAIEAVAEGAMPNARDYHPQGPDAYRVAISEYSSRMHRLRSVLEELTAIHEALTGEDEARQSRKVAPHVD